MLENAKLQAVKYSGKSLMWRNPYAKSNPRKAVGKASVWYTAYPVSTITRADESVLRTLGDPKLWKAFQKIGIKALHTGPMKQAGGLDGWEETPSVDGHFDRISNRIDAAYGTDQDFARMCKTAAAHGGIIIDDIIPGHTGKGADFRLAEMKYENYPGIYHMVEIDPKDWGLLPKVPKGRDAMNIDPQTEEKLKRAGYIIGRMQRVIFYEPGVKETNWSATREVRGVDGEKRRWVYLHYFKEGQPTLNWLDPSFSGMQLVVGDALHSLGTLGSSGLRLDANGFLGIETSNADSPAWSEGHPLSYAANQLIAGMVRKVGSFTFQELNLAMDDIKEMSDHGPDLSYDFITRPSYHHALVTGDAEFLRLTLREARKLDIDPASLVHALQNHDDLTYELVHFGGHHRDDKFEFRRRSVTGRELFEIIRHEMSQTLVGERAPYNLRFSENGIACTTISVITAVLGYEQIDIFSAADIERIRRLHLLLVMFNAFQPGVFALSGWDLAGALVLGKDQVAKLLADGDTRWINRGAYDLMGVNPRAAGSVSGMPTARSLYGALPKQLKDPGSFASRLGKMLAVREKYGLAAAKQLAIPEVFHQGLVVGGVQVTAINFSAEKISGAVSSEHFVAGADVIDMMTDERSAAVDDRQRLPIALDGYQGVSLLIGKIA